MDGGGREGAGETEGGREEKAGLTAGGAGQRPSLCKSKPSMFSTETRRHRDKPPHPSKSLMSPFPQQFKMLVESLWLQKCSELRHTLFANGVLRVHQPTVYMNKLRPREGKRHRQRNLGRKERKTGIGGVSLDNCDCSPQRHPFCNQLWGPGPVVSHLSLQLGPAAEDHAGKSLGKLIPPGKWLGEGGDPHPPLAGVTQLALSTASAPVPRDLGQPQSEPAGILKPHLTLHMSS